MAVVGGPVSVVVTEIRSVGVIVTVVVDVNLGIDKSQSANLS